MQCTPYKLYSEDSLVLAAGGADFSSAGLVSLGVESSVVGFSADSLAGEGEAVDSFAES